MDRWAVNEDIEVAVVGMGSIEAGLNEAIGADVENGSRVVRRSWVLTVEEAKKLERPKKLGQ